MSGKTVKLVFLVICEHCEALLDLEGIPIKGPINKWKCPKCEESLTTQTLGYSENIKKARRIKWVGLDGKWTTTKPTENFHLGDMFVLVGNTNAKAT